MSQKSLLSVRSVLNRDPRPSEAAYVSGTIKLTRSKDGHKIVFMESAYRNRVEEFFRDLKFRYRIVKTAKEQVDRYLASDFNLVAITRPEETDISRFIALLLEPKGTHGQGDVFLQKFVEILKRELPEGSVSRFTANSDKFKDAQIITEYTTSKGRRIDLLIKLPTGFRIGIENKIYAGDQEKQLLDYSEYLKDTSGNNYVLIYLTCGERTPSMESIPEELRKKLEKTGNFISLSYKKFLIPWLQECLKGCEADKVRWFIRDFITWVYKNCEEVKSNGQPESA